MLRTQSFATLPNSSSSKTRNNFAVVVDSAVAVVTAIVDTAIAVVVVIALDVSTVIIAVVVRILISDCTKVLRSNALSTHCGNFSNKEIYFDVEIIFKLSSFLY